MATSAPPFSTLPKFLVPAWTSRLHPRRPISIAQPYMAARAGWGRSATSPAPSRAILPSPRFHHHRHHPSAPAWTHAGLRTGRPFMRWAPTDSGPHRPPTAATGAPSPSSSAAALHRVLFHTSAAAAGGAQREHHFDTLACVRRLQDEGFSEAQAAAVMRVLSSVLDEAMQKLRATLVARDAHERAAYTQQVDFGKLRSELVAADSSEASLTRASHERLTNDLAKLNARLRDDIGRTQASVRLDFNLEKGRIREEANVQDLRIQETQARIEQEAAGLRERVEGVKFSTLQWLMGVCTGTAALLLGAWRLLT